VNKDVVSTLMKGHIPTQDPEQVKEAQRRRQVDMSRMKTQKSDFSQYSHSGGGGPEKEPQRPTEPVRVEKKVGRNDPCPCGSGKKYKQCHGAQQSSPVANA
jgi:preprotein translocase subunit SecA